MTKYIVEPKSRSDMRAYANLLRRKLGLTDVLYFPIVELLDSLAEIFPEFSYEIVPDHVLGKDIHADTDIRTGHVRIKESVYERACDGEGRDRMTIAHEIGHYFTLCHCGFRLTRNFGKTEVPCFKDPEWQSKCFAGELMIPYQLTKDMNPARIARVCGVSFDAALYQSKKYKK